MRSFRATSKLKGETSRLTRCIALREGLVNAVVHRDYSLLGGSVSVELFSDRLTIHNAGTLPTGWNVQN